MKKFNVNRKTLSIVLCLILVSVFTLTIAYAALNAVLTISGSAQVSSAEWDVHFDNVKVTSGSVSGDEPQITSPTTVIFSTVLNMPGEYYEFSIDVVNDGSIDAMIENITKTPTLTSEQAKYLKYDITYQNGESITTKQLVEKKSFVRLKVRLEFRNDLSSSDLPTSSETLNLGLKLDYTQSDGSGSSVSNGGVASPISANGDINDIGTIVTIGSEQFYTIGIEGNNVKLLSMYNLHVGNKTLAGPNYLLDVVPLTSPTGIQDSTARGWVLDADEFIGTVMFSENEYWLGSFSTYPAYVYNSNSELFTYVENYKNYLSLFNVNIENARLISLEELESLGCVGSSCEDAPKWVYSTSYWAGTARDAYSILEVDSGAYCGAIEPYAEDNFGVRPVIVISKDYFAKEKISFTLSGINYQADVGMTWEDWCNSEYNGYGCAVFDDYIIDLLGGAGNKKYYVCLEESESCVRVLKNDLIIDGASYSVTI